MYYLGFLSTFSRSFSSGFVSTVSIILEEYHPRVRSTLIINKYNNQVVRFLCLYQNQKVPITALLSQD